MIFKKIWKSIGPGFITGAADDDPSGIATYTVAGARYGFQTLWLALYCLPLMVAIQEMCGRIGSVSGRGLIANMRTHYSRLLLGCVAIVLLIANTVNIGADLSAIGTVIHEVVPAISPSPAAAFVAIGLVLFLVFFSYRRIASVLKWFALVMVAYIFATFLVRQDWSAIVRHTIIPSLSLSRDYILIIIAIIGTTISPYLFFWQASEEVEEKREMYHQHASSAVVRKDLEHIRGDTAFGMFFSNLLTFFIIVLSGSTLFVHGATGVTTMFQIASALRPLAGSYSTQLFLIALLASGLLAIPVLAGSAAYALSELFGWREGMNKKFHQAPQFYVIIAASTLIGLLMPFLGIDPVQALLYTAFGFGIISPILVALVIHMGNNKKIMGSFTNSPLSNTVGGISLVLMTGIVVAYIVL